jgi:hypothetical protein
VEAHLEKGSHLELCSLFGDLVAHLEMWKLTWRSGSSFRNVEAHLEKCSIRNVEAHLEKW